MDDEPHMVRLLKLNLEPEGYQVIEAMDGDEAYKKTLEIDPDILLLDVMVPKRSGLDICKTLKKNEKTAHIPIVLITGRGEGMRKAAAESGADLFLTKPFSPLHLLSEIRRMVPR